jgi:hypothetical protein
MVKASPGIYWTGPGVATVLWIVEDQGKVFGAVKGSESMMCQDLHPDHWWQYTHLRQCLPLASSPGPSLRGREKGLGTRLCLSPLPTPHLESMHDGIRPINSYK